MSLRNPARFFLVLACVCGVAGFAALAEEKPAAKEKPAEKKADEKEEKEWKSLFDGKKLDPWKVSDFGGKGDVRVEEGLLVLEMGEPITGVTWHGEKLPKIDYEIELEARKVQGNDFFCGLTFPVEDSFCSLIMGGWGGATVGLSSLDGNDASENETTQFMTFEKNRWYKIRLRVAKGRIQAWMDDKEFINVDTTGKKISIRREVELSTPLGISTFHTHATLRNLKLRELKPEEKGAAEKKKKKE